MKNRDLMPINRDINFKQNRKKERYFLFFNCDKCGFHECVIEKYWIQGDMDNFILFIKEIHPYYEKTISVIGDSLKTDGILCSEYICGKCKVPGKMLPVPTFILDTFGFAGPYYKDSKNKKRKPKRGKLLDSLKEYLSKKTNIKSRKDKDEDKKNGSD